MYSNIAYNEHESFYDTFEYAIEPIKVLLVRSQINFEKNMKSVSTCSKESITEFILKLPVYDNLGVPLNILINDLNSVSKLSFQDHQILYRTTESPLYVLAGVYPFHKESVYIPVFDILHPIIIKSRATGKIMRKPQVQKPQKAKIRRGNERIIGDVIDALIQYKIL